MKTIKIDDLREGTRNFIESFRDQNDDVTRFASEKLVNSITNEKKNKNGFSGTKISDRRITSGGVR